MRAFPHPFYFVLTTLVFIGCAPTGRYYQHQDSAPKVVPNQVTKVDAVPVYEQYAPANMRPYKVRGVRYQPLSTGKGFVDKGQASWYGQKFHGHLTANGEVYDMYQMSAAHKTLPLPSFVRVTNLANGKQAVVRVNDRGPFHLGRVIDLSYAAAAKIDMLKTGVADVKIEVIHVDPSGTITVGNHAIIEPAPANKQIYIQVAALKNKSRIEKMGKGLQNLYQHPYEAKLEKNIYKLRLGPIQASNADKLLTDLQAQGYPEAYKVYAD